MKIGTLLSLAISISCLSNVGESHAMLSRVGEVDFSKKNIVIQQKSFIVDRDKKLQKQIALGCYKAQAQGKKVDHFLTQQFSSGSFYEVADQLASTTSTMRTKIFQKATKDQKLFLKTLSLPRDSSRLIIDELCDHDQNVKAFLLTMPMGKAFEWHALMREKYKKDSVLRQYVSFPRVLMMQPQTVIALHDTVSNICKFPRFYPEGVVLLRPNHIQKISADTAHALSLLPTEIKDGAFFYNTEFDVQETWAETRKQLVKDVACAAVGATGLLGYDAVNTLGLSKIPRCLIKSAVGWFYTNGITYDMVLNNVKNREAEHMKNTLFITAIVSGIILGGSDMAVRDPEWAGLFCGSLVGRTLLWQITKYNTPADQYDYKSINQLK